MRTHTIITPRTYLLIGIILLSACQTEPPPPTATPSPVPPTEVPTSTPFVAVGVDITIDLPQGDVDRGQQATLKRGCIACHGTGIGPNYFPSEDLPGIAERATTRISQDDYTGSATSAEQYLFESIVLPSAYVVDGFSDGIMISQSSRLMSAQEVADVIAYLLTLR